MKFWDWARDVLIPGLYEDSKDVTLSNSTPYTGDGDAVLVGMPRLRQLRVRKRFIKGYSLTVKQLCPALKQL